MSWPMVKLAEVCQINPRLPKGVDEEQEVSFLAMASVSEEGQILTQESRILGETKKGFTYFEKDDVIVAKITPCFENGKAAFLDSLNTQIGFGSTEFHVLRPNEGQLDGKYLFYLVWNDKFRFVAERNMSGSAGQKRVPTDFFKKLEIPLPPLDEQKRITAILDKADAIRQKRKQALALADDFLRSVFLDMFGDIDGNGWGLTTVEKLAQDKKGSMRTGPFGSQLLHSEFTESGIAVLGIDNAVNNKFEWSKSRFISEDKYKELHRYTVYPGDVIITIMGTCGRCAVVPNDIPVAINTKHLCCITLDQEKCLPSFLHAYFLYHPEAKRYLAQNTKGAIMAGLNMGIIKGMPVPEVPITLQERFEDLLRYFEKTSARLGKGLVKTEANFISLSQKAFSGQL
ncbi:restriction endonuclease subunit S [Shewanella indica]|uniref:restriction endonuclease subunit S n=1 Tax=Shewanella indica TaxID=768528 RepID=UPI00313B638A